MRQVSGGFPVLRWLDWDCLLDGLVPAARPGEPVCPSISWALPDRAPGPRALEQVPESLRAVRDAWVVLLQWPSAAGAGSAVETLQASLTRAEDQQWVDTLLQARLRPARALKALARPNTVREAYLREYLELTHELTRTNLEWVVFRSKLSLKKALARWPESPPLHFVRALASSLMGQNATVLDDLARAVYFSRQSAFYVEAVRRTPYVVEARPALARQCAADPTSVQGSP